MQPEIITDYNYVYYTVSSHPDWMIQAGDSDVGDIVMLVTLWWWLIWDIGGRIIMLVIFSMY